MARRTSSAAARGGEADRPPGAEFLNAGGKLDTDALRAALAARQAEAEGEVRPDEDDAELRRITLRVGRGIRKRLDRYLTDRITFLSRSQLQRLIEGGGVLVNERMPKASTTLRAGDVVEVVVPPPPSEEIEPEEIPLDVLYEDEHLVVINKPADIITHPARSHQHGTLVNALAWHVRHAPAGGGALSGVGREQARPGVVHRLDRDTTGVMVFAKRDEAHWRLGHQFEHRRVEKRYLAVVHGTPEPAGDIVELPIGPHPSREKGYREKYVVRHDALGKPAVTVYRTLERYEPASGVPRTAGETPGARPARFALLELELRTGRTHQIRVHLSHLGWAIVGDEMYGGRAFAGPDGRVVMDRQALHAAYLSFRHPMTDEAMTFTAPAPADLRALVAHLRRSGRVERPGLGGTLVDVERALGDEGARPAGA